MDEVMKSVKEVLDSERLVTARMIDSVLRTNQLASIATPEMQDMFSQWLGLIGEQVLSELEDKEECDVPSLAKRIGVSETTLFSLLVFLHRSGRIRIEALRYSEGPTPTSEACDCLQSKG